MTRATLKASAIALFAGGMLALPAPVQATLEHQQKFFAPVLSTGALFGTSVAVDGDLAVVGAPHDEGAGGAADRGAAYIYVWDGDSWNRRARLTAASSAAGDAFGVSVAIDGTTIVVGANGVDLSPSTDEGAAFVFEQNGDGDWEQKAVLVASDGTTGHATGTSVAIDGDTVAVGASLANISIKADQGAVYTFERSGGGTWFAADKLTASDGEVGDHLGLSVAIDGDTIVAGADAATGAIPVAADYGALYTFDRSGAASRTQTAKLTASDGATGDSLGTSVAIDGDTIVGGADFDQIGSNVNQGSVYTFARTGGSRAETAKLTASDGAAGNHLGASVAIDGDTIVAGATSLVVGSGSNPGAGYTFARTGAAARTQTAKLTAGDAASGDHMGTAAAISSGRVLIGANTDDVDGTNNAGSVIAFDTPAPAGTFTAVTPFRLLDTRNGTGAPQAKVGAGQSVSFQVAGNGGVPADSASAVVLNVTVTNPTAAGFITAYPGGLTKPLASNLNFTAGQTIPNHVTVQLSTGLPSLGGDVTLYNGSPGTVDLIADVAGWYRGGVATEAGTFTAITPTRLLDTRNGTGAAQAKVSSTGRVDFDVEGEGGIPSSGVGAAALNITVTNPTAAGFITAFPSGLPPNPPPLASNLNFSANQTIPNAANVKVGQGLSGQVALYNGSPGTVDLIADAAGWFKSGAATVPGSYTPLTPARILDTRNGTGAPQAKVPAGGTINLAVGNHGGVPPTNTASSASAVVLNVTVTNPGAEGFITVYPAGDTKPLASSLNFTSGKTIPNLVTVKLFSGGFGGVVRLYNGSSQPVDLIADVAGWYHR